MPISKTPLSYCTVTVTVVEVAIAALAESFPVTVNVYFPAVVAEVLGAGGAL
jgi:hypothetical protein